MASLRPVVKDLGTLELPSALLDIPEAARFPFCLDTQSKRWVEGVAAVVVVASKLIVAEQSEGRVALAPLPLTHPTVRLIRAT
jgi:hypothetical protein